MRRGTTSRPLAQQKSVEVAPWRHPRARLERRESAGSANAGVDDWDRWDAASVFGLASLISRNPGLFCCPSALDTMAALRRGTIQLGLCRVTPELPAKHEIVNAITCGTRNTKVTTGTKGTKRMNFQPQ